MKKPIKKKNDKYRSGWLPIADKVFKVETVKNGKFILLGEILVTGGEVGAEMDAAQSIKGHTHENIAGRIASERYPKTEPLIVTEIS